MQSAEQPSPGTPPGFVAESPHTYPMQGLERTIQRYRRG
jgi:hypothetical protein